MHDHDFEKQVHQKMEELRLSPSDTVWERVEGQLHKKKRRRILFWTPLLLLSLAAGGYYFMQHDRYTGRTILSSANQTTSGTTKKITEKAAGATSKLPKINTLPSGSLPPAAIASFHTQSHRKIVPAPVLLHSASTSVAEERLNEQRQQTDKNKADAIQQKEIGAVNTADPETEKITSSTVQEPADQTNSGVYSDPSAATVSDVSSTRMPFHTVFTVPLSNTAAYTIKLSGKKSLHWGIQVEAMRTAVHEGSWNKLLGGTNRADFSMFNPGNLSSNQGNVTVVPVPVPARAGAGFSAGFFLGKKLSPRLTVSIGVNYALFTTSMMIGSARNSTAAQFASSGVNQYFSAGNGSNSYSYTNRYHFLELPVLLQFRLNKGKVPVVWEGGGSVARLLTSNALQYSNQLNGYYKNNSLLNRTQVNLFTGFHIETFSSTQHPVRIGPQIHASLSNLSTLNGSKRSYFTQVGLKISSMIR